MPYGISWLSGESANAGLSCLTLSTEAVEITRSPTLGAPVVHRPSMRSLPADATTTTPLFTSRDAARDTGAPGQLLKVSPMLMFSTSAPSR